MELSLKDTNNLLLIGYLRRQNPSHKKSTQTNGGVRDDVFIKTNPNGGIAVSITLV